LPVRRRVMSCCRASTGVNPQDQHRLHQELLTIAQSFPQTRIACVVNRQGEIIAEILPDGFEREAMLSHLEHLKCAAAQLGASLGQGECPVLHIKGKRNVFSLYDVQGEGKEHIGVSRAMILEFASVYIALTLVFVLCLDCCIFHSN